MPSDSDLVSPKPVPVRQVAWAVALAALILFIRKSDSLTNPQLWAEDGVYFFLQQYELGAWALFEAFSGYLHIIPRLVALLADVAFPYSATPAVYNYASGLIHLVVVASVFSPRFQVGHKPLMALAVVLVPHYAHGEVFLNLTNAQWSLSLLLIMVLLKERPDGRFGSIAVQYGVDLAIIVLCGLTGPFALLLLPLFGWRWFRDKGAYSRVMFAAMAAVSVVQLCFILRSPIHAQGANVELPFYSAFLGYRVFGDLFLGVKNCHDVPVSILVVLYVLLLGALTYAAYPKNRLIVFCIVIHGIYLAAGLYKFRSDPAFLLRPGNCQRYMYVPYIMLSWALIDLLGRKQGWQRSLWTVVLSFMLFSSITSFFQSRPLKELNWRSYSASIGREDVFIPINPDGWGMEVRARHGSGLPPAT